MNWACYVAQAGEKGGKGHKNEVTTNYARQKKNSKVTKKGWKVLVIYKCSRRGVKC